MIPDPSKTSIERLAGLAPSARRELGGTIPTKGGTPTGIAFVGNGVFVALQTGDTGSWQGFGIGNRNWMRFSRRGGGHFEMDRHDENDLSHTQTDSLRR